MRDVPVDDTTDAPGPPRWFEMRLGGHTTTVRDAELTRLLSEVTPEQPRALLRKCLGATKIRTRRVEQRGQSRQSAHTPKISTVCVTSV